MKFVNILSTSLRSIFGNVEVINNIVFGVIYVQCCPLTSRKNYNWNVLLHLKFHIFAGIKAAKSCCTKH